MKLKYNIAFIPTIISEQFIKLSQAFSPIAENYVLGPHSLPHVTLHQFFVEETEINFIWEQINEFITEKSMPLQFKQFSFISHDGRLYWLSLLPDHCEDLNTIHHSIANRLQLPIGPLYDAHLTLINTTHSEYQHNIHPSIINYTPLSDSFLLSLGRCDEIGQYTEIMHVCDRN